MLLVLHQLKTESWRPCFKVLGQKFFWKSKEKWNWKRAVTLVNSVDLGFKKNLIVSYMPATLDVLSALEMHISHWSRMVRIVTAAARFENNLIPEIKHKAGNKTLKKITHYLTPV